MLALGGGLLHPAAGSQQAVWAPSLVRRAGVFKAVRETVAQCPSIMQVWGLQWWCCSAAAQVVSLACRCRGRGLVWGAAKGRQSAVPSRDAASAPQNTKRERAGQPLPTAAMCALFMLLQITELSEGDATYSANMTVRRQRWRACACGGGGWVRGWVGAATASARVQRAAAGNPTHTL